jgi:hypothetical protein
MSKRAVLRSQIILMWLRLRVKILMRLQLWLRPYCKECQIFKMSLSQHVMVESTFVLILHGLNFK